MSWRIRIREGEGDRDQPFLLWDTVLKDAGTVDPYWDWELAGLDAPLNSGGLQATNGLTTAVMIQTFTNRRARPDMELPDESGGVGGWWGDSVAPRADRYERELGSHLWVLRRTTLNSDTLARAVEYETEALQPIVDQGAVAEFEVKAFASNVHLPAHGNPDVLELYIDAFAQSGSKVYSQRFQILWDQKQALAS